MKKKSKAFDKISQGLKEVIGLGKTHTIDERCTSCGKIPPVFGRCCDRPVFQIVPCKKKFKYKK